MQADNPVSDTTFWMQQLWARGKILVTLIKANLWLESEFRAFLKRYSLWGAYTQLRWVRMTVVRGDKSIIADKVLSNHVSCERMLSHQVRSKRKVTVAQTTESVNQEEGIYNIL